MIEFSLRTTLQNVQKHKLLIFTVGMTDNEGCLPKKRGEVWSFYKNPTSTHSNEKMKNGTRENWMGNIQSQK